MNRKLTGELARFYRELDEEVKRLGMDCRACGRCCHFAQHGHELFCSQLEAEYLAADRELPELVGDDVCPFLDEIRCTRRATRTLACRTYFCDAAGNAQTHALTEVFIRRLKALHSRFGLPWRYAPLSVHLNRRKAWPRKE